MDNVRTLSVLFVLVAVLGTIIALFTDFTVFGYTALVLVIIYLLIVINRPLWDEKFFSVFVVLHVSRVLQFNY